MSSPYEHCSKCRFWDVYDGDLSRDLGDCRRRPPLVSEELLTRNLPGLRTADDDEPEHAVYPASIFPVTHATSWCGDFEDQQPVVPC